MKWMISLLSIAMTIIFVVNIYLYFGKEAIKVRFDKDIEYSMVRNELNKFQIEVMELGEIQRMYILTKEESLKNQYKNRYQLIHQQLETYKEKVYVSYNNYRILTNMLKDYDDLSQTLFLLNNKNTFSNENVQMLKSSIEIQENVVGIIAEELNNKQVFLEKEGTTLLTKLENHVTTIHIGSGVFSTFLTSFFVYFRKHFHQWFLIVKNKVTTYRNQDEELEKELMELRFYQQFIKSYHQFMEKRWEDNKIIVEEIFRRLNGLEKNDEENTKQLKENIYQLRILFQELPGYHEMVVDFLRTNGKRR